MEPSISVCLCISCVLYTHENADYSQGGESCKDSDWCKALKFSVEKLGVLTGHVQDDEYSLT